MLLCVVSKLPNPEPLFGRRLMSHRASGCERSQSGVASSSRAVSQELPGKTGYFGLRPAVELGSAVTSTWKRMHLTSDVTIVHGSVVAKSEHGPLKTT
jgi:hypothetical protein